MSVERDKVGRDYVKGQRPVGLILDEAVEVLENFPRLESDLVNHPPHYRSNPSGVECIDVTEHMNFNVGNAVKYLWRAGSKDDELVDLRKARWYVDREIQRLSRQQRPLLPLTRQDGTPFEMPAFQGDM